MEPKNLLAISALSGAKLSEIAARNPELFKELQQEVTRQKSAAALAGFAESPVNVREAVRAIDFGADKNLSRPVSSVVADLLDAPNLDRSIKAQIAKQLAALSKAGPMTEGAAADAPLKDHPLFRPLIEQAQVAKLAAVAKLPDASADALLKEVSGRASLTETRLVALVEGKVLTEPEAKRLGFAASVVNVADGDAALAQTLMDNIQGEPGPERLAQLSLHDWETALQKAQAIPPDGSDLKQYAEELRRRVAGLYPNEILLRRVMPRDTASFDRAFAKAKPLFDLNEKVLGRDFDSLKTGDVGDAAKNELRAAHAELWRLARLHPGLGLEGVLEGKAPPPERLKEVGRRLALIENFEKQNPDIEVIDIDFTAGSDDVKLLKFEGVSAADQKLVITNLKTYQRAYALAGDVVKVEPLLAAGYTSAVAIARERAGTFAERTGLKTEEAALIHARAREMAGMTIAQFGGVMEVALGGGFGSMPVGNVEPSALDYLKKLDGFADLFGSQDYCDCEHCQSILSPAAYFVDLMAFVDENVTQEHFSGARANHVLALKSRRPDLWNLPLTCDNTNTRIPYLDIINEILENYIAKRRGFSGDLNDRIAVENEVYREALPSRTDSLRQPVIIPFARVNLYLGHFSRSRAGVAAALGASEDVLAAARLGLSQPQRALIVAKNEAPPFLSAVFGADFLPGAGDRVSPIETKIFLKHTGLTRDDIETLSRCAYVTARGAQQFRFVQEKRSPDSVQNDMERVHDLTPSILDRLHRFVRLARHLSWSWAETDLVLDHILAAGLAPELDGEALLALAQAKDMSDRLGVPVEPAVALFSAIPNASLEARIPGFLDRLFNSKPFTLVDGPLPKPAAKFLHPAFRETSPAPTNDTTLPRLVSGLQIDAEQLATLIRELAGPLGVNFAPGAPEADRGVLLTEDNLTLLYRHARLAQALKISIPQLFQLVALEGIGGGRVGGLADAIALVDLHAWWKTTGLSLDDLGVVTHGRIDDPSRYPAPAAATRAIAADIADERLTQFADTVLAFLPGVTESQSRELIAANEAAFVSAGSNGLMRLSDGFDPAVPLAIPAGIAVAEVDAKAVLMAFHASRVAPVKLAARLGLSAEKIGALLNMTDADVSASGVVQAINGGPLSALEAIIADLLPLSVLFRAAAFDVEAIEFVQQNPSIFGVADFKALTLDAIKKIVAYRHLIEAPPEARFRADLIATDAAAVREALLGFDPATKFAGVATDRLAAAARAEPSQIGALLPNVALPASAPEALTILAEAAGIARHLGVDGETLKLLVADGYDDLSRAAEGLVGAFRAKYPDAAEFEKRIEPYEDKLRSLKRDALVDYLIRSVHPEFETKEELYQHFLVDVQLEGCARTSRVVAAISSLQLYVHRVLINLEQDRREADDPAHVHVPPAAIPAEEWAWRKNYRVWEANRKVFLYPENYIEPDLRDDKSPLFEELEQTLLQQEINEQTALDAYTRYLAGFEDVARLKIAGICHDKNAEERTDILHMFGATQSDPPVYYYRAVENAFYGERYSDRGVMWSPWRKVEVQIPVRKVAPVVYLGRLFVFWIEIATQAANQVADGGSVFVGYKHKFKLRYTWLRLDGAWSPPQAINLDGAQAPKYNACAEQAPGGVVSDPLADPGEDAYFLKTPRYDVIAHPDDPREDYTLQGYVWDQPYPEIKPNGDLILTAIGFATRAKIDLVEKRIIPLWNQEVQAPPVAQILSIKPATPTAGGDQIPCLFSGIANDFILDPYAQTTISRNTLNDSYIRGRIIAEWDTDQIYSGIHDTRIAELRYGDDLIIVNGSVSDAILTTGQDLIYLQYNPRRRRRFARRHYLAKRLGTRLADELCRTLFTDGIDGLLDIETQKALGEPELPFRVVRRISDRTNAGKIDFKGSLGVNFREIFFHVPFLIANHLNAQGRYAAAQRWYHFIFNPTASETITLPPGLDAEAQAWRRRDRVWRYVEFRGQDAPKLRETLTDASALEAYKKDPFNPHAIARLRLSAYQKAIVMKYVDNLLDWGDSLFAEFTMESVNEAIMLYVMASDILGPWPEKLGSCGEGGVAPKTYANIAPHIGRNEEFLIELEQSLVAPAETRPEKPAKRRPSYVLDKGDVHEVSTGKRGTRPPPKVVIGKRQAVEWGLVAGEGGPAKFARAGKPMFVSEKEFAKAGAIELDTEAVGATATSSGGSVLRKVDADRRIARPMNWAKTGASGWTARKGKNKPIIDFDGLGRSWFDRYWRFGWSLVRQMGPVFCIPENKELEAYWRRVADRLYKIRNCMDITGARRELALFAPEIDPRLLVRARAAGLSLEDVLNATSGSLPPYRFLYLIEKAKQSAATVQAFGAALSAALERRDNEELARLRTVHQQNLLKMATKLRELEIKAADEALAQLSRQQAAIEYRRDYYAGLADEGLIAWEHAQQKARYAATVASGLAALQQMVAGITYLMPQVGSPFAMKYGGKEMADSAKAWSRLAQGTATLSEQISAAAGLEAGFERRSEGWGHQIKLAEHELTQIAKQITAAEIRKQIADRSLQIHQESVKQAEELFDFHNERFTNLGLFSYLATTMQRLYREAYNGALGMARLAEQAFRFERGDDATPLLEPSYWDASRAGLLAGERLMLDLQAMERRFIETNARTIEVDQPFSLAQLDPRALIALKETGICEFSIPELAFDLFYPGQYRRLIKAVRLTIPCVTGPFTNVGATLTLTASKIRRESALGETALKDVPLRRSTTIATSTAQNDAGVFEFSFRDERYMPFEGAGAVSSWSLTLPTNFRPFDYQTITDAILHIAYVAEFDDAFRQDVEAEDASIEGTIVHFLSNVPLQRTISLRQDFPSAYTRLLHSPAATEVPVEITDRHFPLFLRGRTLQTTTARLALRTAPGRTVTGVSVNVNGQEQTEFSQETPFGGLWTKTVGTAITGSPITTHVLAVNAAGNLAPDAPEPGDISLLDTNKIQDILLHIEFKLA